MKEILTVAFIVAMYLGTMMGMVLFLAFVCRVGDLGFMFLGWLDQKIQDRAHKKSEGRVVQFPVCKEKAA